LREKERTNEKKKREALDWLFAPVPTGSHTHTYNKQKNPGRCTLLRRIENDNNNKKKKKENSTLSPFSSLYFICIFFFVVVVELFFSP
jgi:hypothetical protein